MTKVEIFRQKMEREGLSSIVIETFLEYYSQLISSKESFIREEKLKKLKNDAVKSITDLSEFEEFGRSLSNSVAVIKLNGGLGTSMGLSGPKCLLKIKDGKTFFDLTALQIISDNKSNSSNIPFILMNSFYTDRETKNELKKYPELKSQIPKTFLQNMYPKISQETLAPVDIPKKSRYEWNPPGHGDIYTALSGSGMIDKLLSNGIRYLFVSNIDNLGASLDYSLLGYFAKNNLDFMMEVVKRTEMDKKGGHVAIDRDSGKIILRERAQCHPDDISHFEDIEKYEYFNSNNIWINIESVKRIIDKNEGKFILPLIVNSKKAIPFDKTSEDVFQLETAIGSAIANFDKTKVVKIDSERFRPVKKWADIIKLRSDKFRLNDRYRLVETSDHTLTVELDQKFYSQYSHIEERFPHGIPSLVNCSLLRIDGDFRFGKNIKAVGKVELVNDSCEQIVISDNTVLS